MDRVHNLPLDLGFSLHNRLMGDYVMKSLSRYHFIQDPTGPGNIRRPFMEAVTHSHPIIANDVIVSPPSSEGRGPWRCLVRGF